jgi:hypothetical protein
MAVSAAFRQPHREERLMPDPQDRRRVERVTMERSGRRAEDLCDYRGVCGVDRLSGRVDGQDQRLNDMNERLTALRAAFDTLTAAVNKDLTDFRGSVTRDMTELSGKVVTLSADVARLFDETSDQTELLTTISTAVQQLSSWKAAFEATTALIERQRREAEDRQKGLIYPVLIYGLLGVSAYVANTYSHQAGDIMRYVAMAGLLLAVGLFLYYSKFQRRSP